MKYPSPSVAVETFFQTPIVDLPRFQIRRIVVHPMNDSVEVELHTTDRDTGAPTVIRFTSMAPFMDVATYFSNEERASAIAQHHRDAIVNAVIHEVDEHLRFNGRRLNEPHPNGTAVVVVEPMVPQSLAERGRKKMTAMERALNMAVQSLTMVELDRIIYTLRNDGYDACLSFEHGCRTIEIR